MHTFWLTLIVPAVLLSQWIWPVLKIRTIWSVAATVVALLTLGYLALGLPELSADQQSIVGVLKMAVFRCLKATDLPLVQLLIGCLAGRFFSNQTYWKPETDLVAAPGTSS